MTTLSLTKTKRMKCLDFLYHFRFVQTPSAAHQSTSIVCPTSSSARFSAKILLLSSHETSTSARALLNIEEVICDLCVHGCDCSAYFVLCTNEGLWTEHIPGVKRTQIWRQVVKRGARSCAIVVLVPSVLEEPTH